MNTAKDDSAAVMPEFDFRPLVQFDCTEQKQFPRFVLPSEIAAAWFDVPDCKTATITLRSGIQFTVDAPSLVRAFPLESGKGPVVRDSPSPTTPLSAEADS